LDGGHLVIRGVHRHARFHRDVHLRPLPDEAKTDEEPITQIADIHQELAEKLAILVEPHEPLGSGLEDAISQGVISSEEVSDFREYVAVTGRWTTIPGASSPGLPRLPGA
jgi:hypothetical protein